MLSEGFPIVVYMGEINAWFIKPIQFKPISPKRYDFVIQGKMQNVVWSLFSSITHCNNITLLR